MLQIQVSGIPNNQILVEKKFHRKTVLTSQDVTWPVVSSVNDRKHCSATLVQFRNTRQRHRERSSSEGISPFYFLNDVIINFG